MRARLTILAAVVTALVGTSPATAHAEVDDGAGTGARVAVLAGAFDKPERTMQQLHGSLCAPPNVCEPLNYMNLGNLGPTIGGASLDDGDAKLDQWVRSTPGKKVVFGHSLGSSVIFKWLREHSFDPSAPPPSDLSFVTTGAPERRGTGYVWTDPEGKNRWRAGQGFGIPANTPYKVVDICRKWDGFCYFIPGDQRSIDGQMSKRHTDYSQIDVNDPANQVNVEGNVTEVLVPTPGLG
ncbi:putative esterase of the alpha/beta hydrolase fold protein [Mycolicibacterium chubuense NBB4]|uniref:Putative esterase of the alpha/beta hydrolase fold protein n=1 Tax=Mycolicibacterium chubuense (strain NBB4) TaxID=710421 RepID=I4BNS9_MYCCN|nr:PE-PPE domain-containing protein [Mycolicibacterium chubuense]AFM18936.1 putative esterase of the alpha/beta hydrolase fold protein [Mycolicibacterium chubuense NBB4]